MTLQNRLFSFFLWWSVIGFSIWVGGTVFSMSVIVPMWSENPPQSVYDFFGKTTFTKYIFNFFGPPWMAIRNLPLFVALILGWNHKPHRKYLIISAITVIFGIVYTLAYIYPINDVLMINASAGKSAEEVEGMVGKWIFADRLRFIVMIVGYLFLLKTFRLPIPEREV